MGCGRKRRKEELLRFTKGTDEVVFVNGKKSMNGRGFYLCPDLLCFKMAQKKKKRVGSLGSIDLLFPLVRGLE
jgi:predicted RNA-binding protein YlxR (DUF448 family)